jgi:hypothetical protein
MIPVMVMCPRCHRARPIKPCNRSDPIRAANRNCATCAQVLRQSDYDDIAVERMIAGEPAGRASRAEREAAVKVLAGRRLSHTQIAARIGTSTRTVERLKARLAIQPEQRKTA